MRAVLLFIVADLVEVPRQRRLLLILFFAHHGARLLTDGASVGQIVRHEHFIVVAALFWLSPLRRELACHIFAFEVLLDRRDVVVQELLMEEALALHLCVLRVTLGQRQRLLLLLVVTIGCLILVARA